MNEIIEKQKIVGVLYTSGGLSYDLLKVNPVKAFSPIPDTNTFYVVSNGYATHVLVKGDFVIEIEPASAEVEVKFIVDEKEEVSVIFPSPL